MRYQHPFGQRAQQVVKVSIPATGLVADLDAIRQAFEDWQHLLDASHLRAMDDLPFLVEGANRNMLRVNVETDVNHKAPLKSKNLRICTANSTVADWQRLPS